MRHAPVTQAIRADSYIVSAIDCAMDRWVAMNEFEVWRAVFVDVAVHDPPAAVQIDDDGGGDEVRDGHQLGASHDAALFETEPSLLADDSARRHADDRGDVGEPQRWIGIQQCE